MADLLTEQQKKFADLFIQTGNAKQSYIQAGYKARDNVAEANASRLLRHAKVKEYIDKVVAEKSAERIASQDEVLEYLTKVLRGEETEKIPIVGKDYFDLVDNTPSIRDRTKAAELLGKRYALFIDKQEHTGALVVFNGESNLED